NRNFQPCAADVVTVRMLASESVIVTVAELASSGTLASEPATTLVANSGLSRTIAKAPLCARAAGTAARVRTRTARSDAGGERGTVQPPVRESIAGRAGRRTPATDGRRAATSVVPPPAGADKHRGGELREAADVQQRRPGRLLRRRAAVGDGDAHPVVARRRE